MTENKSELNENDLDQADGGLLIMPEMSQYSKDIYNSRGEMVGTQTGNSITFWPCSLCGKPMHTGYFGWFCDPCDNRERIAQDEVWSGSVDDLKAASL